MINNIKLAIVDDDDFYRSILTAFVRPNKDIKIIINVSNGKELIESIDKGRPDVVILDIEMPVMDGIETMDYICEKHPDIKVLILTGNTNEEFFNYLIKKGVNGFIQKGNNFPSIIEAIYTIKNNGCYFANLDLKKVIAPKKSDAKFISMSQIIFSKREIEIIQLICQQYTNKEISKKLFISARTVDGHRNKLLEKANVRNTVGLVIFAMQNDLIRVNSPR